MFQPVPDEHINERWIAITHQPQVNQFSTFIVENAEQMTVNQLHSLNFAMQVPRISTIFGNTAGQVSILWTASLLLSRFAGVKTVGVEGRSAGRGADYGHWGQIMVATPAIRFMASGWLGSISSSSFWSWASSSWDRKLSLRTGLEITGRIASSKQLPGCQADCLWTCGSGQSLNVRVGQGVVHQQPALLGELSARRCPFSSFYRPPLPPQKHREFNGK